MPGMTRGEMTTAMRKTAQNCRDHAAGGRVTAPARDDVRRLSLLAEQGATEIETLASKVEDLEKELEAAPKKSTAKGSKG